MRSRFHKKKRLHFSPTNSENRKYIALFKANRQCLCVCWLYCSYMWSFHIKSLVTACSWRAKVLKYDNINTSTSCEFFFLLCSASQLRRAENFARDLANLATSNFGDYRRSGKIFSFLLHKYLLLLFNVDRFICCNC